ncbi:hypothetical protein CYY_010368, partial [Polysphondylium violaceum]
MLAPTYEYRQYANYNGNCSFYYIAFIQDITGPLQYQGNPNSINKEISDFYSNGTSSSLRLRIDVTVGTGVFNLVVTSGLDSISMDIPYNCQEFPNPIIKDIGFTNPISASAPYKYSFLVENKKEFFGPLNTVINTTEWDHYSDFRDLTTYIVNFHPKPNIPPATAYIAVTVSFPNGFIKTFDIVIPFKVVHQDIKSLEYLPLSETLANKYAVSLNYKRLADLKLSIGGEYSVDYFNLPVYGNPLNATCRGVLNISPYQEGGEITYQIVTIQRETFDNLATFSINIIKPSVLTTIYNFGIGEQTILQGFPSTAFNIEYLNQNLLYRSMEQLVQYDISTTPTPFAPSYYLDDGSYGIVSGTSNSYKVQFNIVNSKYDIRSQVPYYIYSTVSAKNLGIVPSTLDLYPPIITNFQVTPMPIGFNRYFSLRLSVIDDKSGFRRTYLNGFVGRNSDIRTSDLIQGDFLDGTYEVLIDNNYFFTTVFTVYDYASRLSYYGSMAPTSEQQVASLMISNPGGEVSLYCLTNLTSISWSHNDIDVSSVSFSTKFLFNISNADKLFSPSLNFVGYDNLPLETFYGYWNETSEQYEIVVTIPLRAFTGVVKYNLNTKCSLGYVYESPFLYSLFPSSELRVFSNDADMFGPEISKLVQIPAQTAIISAGGTNIGWKLDIYDRLNGFEYGNITIVSDADLTEYTFVLDPNDQTQDISIKIK